MHVIAQAFAVRFVQRMPELARFMQFLMFAITLSL